MATTADHLRLPALPALLVLLVLALRSAAAAVPFRLDDAGEQAYNYDVKYLTVPVSLEAGPPWPGRQMHVDVLSDRKVSTRRDAPPLR